jgi:multiple sugar transport system substrate-binding protein
MVCLEKNHLKIVTKAMIITLIFSMLASCTQTAKTSSSSANTDFAADKSVNLKGYNFILASHWITEYQYQPGKSQLGDKYIELFNKLQTNYNCKITFKNYPDVNAIVDDVTKSIMAGDKPFDVLDLPFNVFQNLIVKDVLYKQNTIKSLDLKSANVNQSVTNMMTFNKNVYGSWYGPYDNISGLFFNKTLLTKEGQSNPYDLYDKGQWTWDNFRKICVAVTKVNADGTKQFGLVGDQQLEKSIVFSNNASIVQVDGNGKYEFGLDKPNAIEAIEFMRTLATQDKVVHPETDWKNVGDVFSSGKAAFLSDFIWASNKFFGDTMKDEYGFVPYPMGPKSKVPNGVVMDARSFVMPKTLTDPEKTGIIYNEIMKMAKYKTDDFQRIYLDKGLDQKGLNIFNELSKTAVADLSGGITSLLPATTTLSEVSRKATKEPTSAFAAINSMMNKAVQDHFNEIK